MSFSPIAARSSFADRPVAAGPVGSRCAALSPTRRRVCRRNPRLGNAAVAARSGRFRARRLRGRAESSLLGFSQGGNRMDQIDMLVIGSGPAGRRAAVQAAKLGKSVLVVDRGRRVGGVSVHTGTIPSKTLRETVLNLSGWRERGFYGRAYRVKQDISRRRPGAAPAHDPRPRGRGAGAPVRAQHGAQTPSREARFLDPHRIEVDHRRRRDQPCRLRERADRRRHPPAPPGQRALRPHAGVRQRRDPRARRGCRAA